LLTVSDTAYAIAFVRALEARLPPEQQLFSDPYAHIFADAGEHAREGIARFRQHPLFDFGVRLRTRYIDDELRAALQAGMRQVVVLGAGFDARALRMDEVSAVGARVYEVDFHALLATKRALLAAAGVSLPPHDVHVPCDFAAPDFGDHLARDLAAAGLVVGAMTAFIWEGVIGYIDRAGMERSLALMARVGGEGSRLVYTYADRSVSADDPTKLAEAAGFGPTRGLGMDEVWSLYLPGPPLEYASIARVGTAVRGPARAHGAGGG
jgi:methyltransferase (TIGR00027 family)